MQASPAGGQAQRRPAAAAGVALAALAVPQALGYAKIAGMPVVTGLYALLIPMAVFAVLGSSRHLVVAADSATAAVLAAALTGMAAPASATYAHLAGLAALITGGLLLLARLARLGFLANFLSRTVLLGFLTGVGIQVAIAQAPDMLGISVTSTHTPRILSRIVRTAAALPQAHLTAVAVSAAVILVVLAAGRITHRFPGALIAAIGAVIVSRAAALARHGVAVIGPFPRGLPPLGSPSLGWHDATRLLGPSTSMFVIILAQSAATARAYAVKNEETVSTDTDLVGLGAANVAAAFTHTFVVNPGRREAPRTTCSPRCYERARAGTPATRSLRHQRRRGPWRLLRHPRCSARGIPRGPSGRSNLMSSGMWPVAGDRYRPKHARPL
jgi:MFS superfamily sulfate permease-like transporter